MATIKDSIVINAPIEKVFAYATDPKNTPEFWPSMVETRNIKEVDGVAKTYDWTYKMGGMRFDGSTEVTEYIPNRRLKTVSRGGIESTLIWEFSPVQGGTRMDAFVDYKVPVPVLGRLAEGLIHKQNERESATIMANLKSLMETPETVAKV